MQNSKLGQIKTAQGTALSGSFLPWENKKNFICFVHEKKL